MDTKSPSQVANSGPQFFEQTSRDANCPQRRIPSAGRPPQWGLLLPPLECSGNDLSTPTHSPKSWKRAAWPLPAPRPLRLSQAETSEELGLGFARHFSPVTVVP